MQQYRSLPWLSLAGLGTATRRLRPPPGPTQTRGCPWPAPGAAATFHAASAGRGVLRTRSPRRKGALSLGVTPPALPVGCAQAKGRPVALMQASAGLRVRAGV